MNFQPMYYSNFRPVFSWFTDSDGTDTVLTTDSEPPCHRDQVEEEDSTETILTDQTDGTYDVYRPFSSLWGLVDNFFGFQDNQSSGDDSLDFQSRYSTQG